MEFLIMVSKGVEYILFFEVITCNTEQILITYFHPISHSKQATNGIVCNRMDSLQRMEKHNFKYYITAN